MKLKNLALERISYTHYFSDIESLHLYAGIHIQIEGYYRLLSKRFPFAVYYQIKGNQVDVFAVLDCRRNPQDSLNLLTSRRT